jgi:RNA polymerase sigma factor (sigma-70 family)
MSETLGKGAGNGVRTATMTTKSDLIASAMEQYQSPLIRYATSILGDMERAREVVQDTFLKLCTQAPERVQHHLAPWLFTVCRNRAFDVRKKDNRMQPLSDTDLRTRSAPGPRPLAALEREEKLKQVFDLVNALPEKEREVLTLKFQCDLSYKEISRITGLSVSNVGFLIHTGVKRVRRNLNAPPAPAPSLVRRLS